MVLAAAALDSVYAISGFGFCLVLAFGGRGDAGALVRLGLAAAELVAGVVMGVVFGKVSKAVARAWVDACSARLNR